MGLKYWCKNEKSKNMDKNTNLISKKNERNINEAQN